MIQIDYKATFLAVFLVLASCALIYSATSSSPKDSTVLINVDYNGVCSGVRISNNAIVTASHCVENAKMWKVNDKSIHKVWNNKEYDVALMSYYDPADHPTSNIRCGSEPPIGTKIHSVTNPLGIDKTHAWGKVASGPKKIARWARVLVTNTSAAPGSSGGPVYDMNGDVAGIIVGGSPRFGGSALMVPGPVICNLISNSGEYVDTPE